MTFSTVKENQASKKITLVRIKPSVTLPHPTYAPTHWTDNGDGTYQTTLLDYAFVALYKCTAASYVKLTMTRALTTTLGNNEWYYDDSSKLLKIKPTGVITDYVFVADFYIFLSSSGNTVTYQDPEDANTTLREWLPILNGLPSSREGIENLTEGILSISVSGVSLVNDNEFILKYLNCDQDFQASFYKKEIRVWLALDDVANITKFFTGLTGNININRNNISIDVKTNFSYLDRKATLTKEGYDPYGYWTLSNWANLNPNDDGKPIRLVMGSVSPMEFKATTVAGITNPLLPLVADKTLKAVCTNYSETVSTSNNRAWGCCRIWDASAIYIGTPISAVDNTAGAYTRLTVATSILGFFEIGDTIELKKTAATTYYGYIYQKDLVNKYLYITKLASIDNTWQPPNPVQRITCVVIKDRTNDANVYYPMVGRDFAYAETDTGSILYSYVTFTNNFEATLSMGTLDPKIHEVYFRIAPSGTGKAGSQPGTVLENILTFAGATVNSVSFDDFDTTMATYCSYAIPTYDESDYSNYYKYVQEILSSCFAYIANNSSQELVVAQFATPISTTEVTESEMIKGSFSESIKYDDIIYQLIAYNPYAKNTLASQTLSNLSAKYLHGIDTLTRFVHCLEDISNTLSKYLAYRSYPKKTISIRTKHQHLDSLIGEDYEVNVKDCNKVGKIIGLDKDQSGATITLDTFGD